MDAKILHRDVWRSRLFLILFHRKYAPTAQHPPVNHVLLHQRMRTPSTPSHYSNTRLLDKRRFDALAEHGIQGDMISDVMNPDHPFYHRTIYEELLRPTSTNNSRQPTPTTTRHQFSKLLILIPRFIRNQHQTANATTSPKPQRNEPSQRATAIMDNSHPFL